MGKRVECQRLAISIVQKGGIPDVDEMLDRIVAIVARSGNERVGQ